MQVTFMNMLNFKAKMSSLKAHALKKRILAEIIQWLCAYYDKVLKIKNRTT